MKIPVGGLLILLLALPTAAGVRAGLSRVPVEEAPDYASEDPSASQMRDEAVHAIAGWPDASRKTAELIMEKYGAPNAIGDRVLVWNGNTPWKLTLVHREDPGLYPTRGGSLQQVIDYEVPKDSVTALEELDAGLSVSPNRRELSGTNVSEEENFLAVNLAHEIITGRSTPAQARSKYALTMALRDSGKSSPLTSRLLFEPAKARAYPAWMRP